MSTSHDEWEQRRAEQEAALAAAGFGKPIHLGDMFGQDAAPCLTCGALVPLAVSPEWAKAQGDDWRTTPLPDDHPIVLHRRFHASRANEGD